LVLDAVKLGLNVGIWYATDKDQKMIAEHSNLARQALKDVEFAVKAGWVPQNYMNAENLSDLANVILQGESYFGDKEIKSLGLDIYDRIYGANWAKNFARPKSFGTGVQEGCDANNLECNGDE
jgi:hypothetical protein